ncbi:aminoalkylphosphonic acid N-acetyltransferase [Oxobacter pfennigii]|uniref:Aminoalkylphosphonic acid N-acetyltransferase n=1 Tax=Oxobacter pfennigii TaxID=36849 RepID=A0A0P8Z1Y8_9CLOT|nr:GNAT family N-acetyltransferase [Oxobacter pfennigii]KPU46135.1 aminoalkylphosphonic acid N-acetyltransferase [Oxobacter pfennigii]
MNIRKAEKNDMEDVFSLICELEERKMDKSNFCTVYLNNLSDSRIHYIVAEQPGKIIGFISIHIQQLLHHAGSIAEIQELIVTEEWQGSGIGHMMFETAKNIASENNCINIEVCSNRRREKSHLFYEKIGMKKSSYKFILQLRRNNNGC